MPRELFTTKMACSAEFSPCRTWRYALYRTWDESTLSLAVVGLNPSTADEVSNDPTVTRCIGFAQKWGFGGLVMLNAFAFRATDPNEMKAVADPVGKDNDKRLRRECERAGMIVLAWGVHGRFRERDAEVLRVLDGLSLHCLGRTKDGHPKHPLYLPGNAMPVEFK